MGAGDTRGATTAAAPMTEGDTVMAARSGTSLSQPKTGRDRGPMRWAALVASGTFLLLGLLGFIPGVTTDYQTMGLTGRNSDAALFGVFQVSVLLNAVHLSFGVIGLGLARTSRGAGAYLIGGGAVVLVLWLIGLATGDGPGGQANLLPANSADNWLHLLLGATMLGVGLRGTRVPPQR